jgi:hypothetical protein
MRFSSISSSFVNEKEKGHIDHLENARQANDHAIEEEVLSEAWLRSERKIVRKLDMTLLPTVWTLYLFKWVVDGCRGTLPKKRLTRSQLLGPKQHRVRRFL